MPSEKLRFTYKIIMILMATIAFGVGIYMLVAVFGGFQNYFTKHFGVSIILLAVAVITLILPEATKTRFGGDSKDNIMKIIAVLLILFAVLTCVLSYFGFFEF